MDAMLASHKDRKRMLDNYEKLGEMAATIALYRLPRDRESLRAVRALLMHETGVYADKMGELMGLADEPDGGRRSHRSGHGVKDGFPHIGHDNALGLTLQPL